MKPSETNQFIYGLHTVQMLLEKFPQRILRLYFLIERHDQKLHLLRRLAEKAHISTRDLSRQEMDHMVEGVHQGIIAECAALSDYHEDDLADFLDKLEQPPFLLILDGVQDPHNLGACLRTAEAAGVHAVIAPKDRNASLTPIARKAASGAAEIIPFFSVTNLARCLRDLKDRGIWLWGADERAEVTCYAADLTGPLGLVMGAEGKGLRHLTKEVCDHLLKIPMQGTISSLNVSVAVGVCLFEALRQRL